MIEATSAPSPSPAAPLAMPPQQAAALREAAQKLEAAFLSEMLGAAGLGEVPDGFGGGAGEAQFASMLRDAQAEAMAKAGGIGLAESIFVALVERQNG